MHFWKKYANASKTKFVLKNYEMQVANLKLPIYMVLNAYFLPSYNGNITWKMNDIVEFWVNIRTHKLRCVASQLCNLLFMKAKFLKVLSSSIEPNTSTITISMTFMYSFNSNIRRGKDWSFNHI